MTIVLYILLLLAEHHGQVIFGGVPVPGATVTATQGDKKFVAVTDVQGAYAFPELGDGPFSVQVEMSGFTTVKQQVTTPTAEFELKMLPIEEMHAEIVKNEPPAAAPAPTAAAPVVAAAAANNRGGAANGQRGQPAAGQRGQAGFQRTEVNASTNAAGAAAPEEAPSQNGAFANLSPEELNRRAADGLLVNGSVNNGAASPFAQLAAFGNNRRGRPLYTGSFGGAIDTSALDAKNYSLTGQDTSRPSYNRGNLSFNIGGPLRIPGIWKLNNAPQFFLGYQRTQNRNAGSSTGRMPTAAERAGDFSKTLNPLGQPVQIVDPLTGQPFAGNIVPQGRISSQALALMNLFPLPNFTDNARYNYQVPIISNQHADGFQGRLSKSINQKNQMAGTMDVQTSRGDNAGLYNFLNTSRSFGVNGSLQWTTRPTQRFSMTFRYQFSRQSSRNTPYFAKKINVSGNAGITGNNQEDVNWGSPTLSFGGGISPLSDSQYSFNRTMNNTGGVNGFWSRGRHNLTFGGDMRRTHLNVLSQQDARGSFTFTGATTGGSGTDFVGFLLGIPDASTIAFGNADKYFRQNFMTGFLRDDWRVSGALTLNVGVQWEYETPVRELRGRLVNLNVGQNFTTATPAVGNDAIHADPLGVQPRLSLAWRPVAASSLIVRAAYGTYRNTNVYQVIANQMAQQSPLSKSLNVANTPANPLTLANGFYAAPNVLPNTFGIDPNFRVGFVQNWQVSMQRDLPYALQMTAMYMGIKGSRLPQEFLPNTYPTGAVNPSGYIYLWSKGSSMRNAGQIQLRRRLRGGLSASAQYTYAKSIDNAPLMAGNNLAVNFASTSIAQNWLDLNADRSRSSFDQRHQLVAQAQYTTGVGVRGGALLSGWRGMLFKEWTIAGQLTVGTGLPLTPVYFATVPGTGVSGNRRPDATGVSVKDAPAGFFLNPAAYRVPAAGTWGNAGRNSITGPSQYSFNASAGRTLRINDRYNMDLRIDATNVLNRVTANSWVTNITNVQFGLPSNFNGMRTVNTTARVRF